MKPNLLESLVSSVSHLIALVGVMLLVINLVGLPIFPTSVLYFLVPNVLLLLLSLLWSKFVRGHVLQALTIHLLGMCLGAIPGIIRFAVSHHILGERWQYTGWGGYGMTPAWALMVMFLAFFALAIFTAACEAIVKAAVGERYQYPLIGRLTSRLSN
jgi:uncharacterized membrane protein